MIYLACSPNCGVCSNTGGAKCDEDGCDSGYVLKAGNTCTGQHSTYTHVMAQEHQDWIPHNNYMHSNSPSYCLYFVTACPDHCSDCVYNIATNKAECTSAGCDSQYGRVASDLSCLGMNTIVNIDLILHGLR